MNPGFVLDTHVWIWLVLGLEIRPDSLERLTQAAGAGELFLPAISVWELGMLEAKGRLRLDRGVEAWVNRALTLPGLRLVGLSPEIALAASRLPGEFHGDPADRLIVATALELQVQLATRDARVQAWAVAGFLSVLEV